jgi:thiol-disulfide isomerase/thioredoxin
MMLTSALRSLFREDVMLRLLPLLVLCFPAVAGDFVVTDRYVISERGINEVSRVVEMQGHPPENNEYYVVMFTGDYCGFCHTYIDSGRWDKLKETFPRSVLINVTKEPKWGNLKVLPSVRKLPTFWLLNAKNPGKVIKVWQGAADAPEMLDVIRPKRMPHRDMVQLHNRLHGGGSWTCPGDLEEHLRSVHGVRDFTVESVK